VLVDRHLHLRRRDGVRQRPGLLRRQVRMRRHLVSDRLLSGQHVHDALRDGVRNGRRHVHELRHHG
jgi:hypothetical protein